MDPDELLLIHPNRLADNLPLPGWKYPVGGKSALVQTRTAHRL